MPIADALYALEGKPRIEAEDVLALREALFEDMTVSSAEAEALFRINDTAISTCPEWRMLFVEALTDYLVRQQDPPGYVDQAKADWLIQRTVADGRIRTDTELELLTYVLEQAEAVPAPLCRFALQQVAAFVLSRQPRGGDGRAVTAQEVARLRRVLYAYAGVGGAAAIGRDEAEVLFAINEAARGRPCDPSWTDLFAKAVGSALLAASGYTPPPATEARRRALWLHGPGEGALTLVARAMRSAVTGGFGETLAEGEIAAEAYEARNAAFHRDAILAAHVTDEEARWLASRIGRDGVLDENEKALLRFVRAEASKLHPLLQPLLDAA